MKNYVVADPHGFCDELVAALREADFFDDAEPHRLILCGDALDRGQQAVEMTDFLISLAEKGELVYVRGNHEDLFIQCLLDISRRGVYSIASGGSHHYHNGMWDTMLQLSGMSEPEALQFPQELLRGVMRSPYYRILLPQCVNYFETAKHVFCHGWIPMAGSTYSSRWREATFREWERARWSNGIAMACELGVLEPDKTIVCGHFHTSYGHSKISKTCSEWGDDADFSPFRASGILALDACTAYSGKVNCIVIEDDDVM